MSTETRSRSFATVAVVLGVVLVLFAIVIRALAVVLLMVAAAVFLLAIVFAANARRRHVRVKRSSRHGVH